MNRRQLFPAPANAALASALGGSWLAIGMKAQAATAETTSAAAQVSGVPGSTSATRAVEGDVLPPPEPPFGGTITLNAAQSTPRWPPRVVPPEDAPNSGGAIPTPRLDRIAAKGLRYTEFHSTALSSPSRAALIIGRTHHAAGFGFISEAATGFPGYHSFIGKDAEGIGEILYDVPGGTRAPHHPTPELMKKIGDMHLFDPGWNKPGCRDLPAESNHGQGRDLPPVPSSDRHRADDPGGERNPAAQRGEGCDAESIDGVSMLHTFDKANADTPSRHRTQYFEMYGDMHGRARRSRPHADNSAARPHG
jgi:hypothetical protein